MSAGGLTAASGFMQGFAQSYNAAHQRALQIQLDQRHSLGQTLATIYADPNTRPEAKNDAIQRILKVYSTPINKKLDKGIGDISTLGQAQVQANEQGIAQAGAAGAGATQAGAFPAGAPIPVQAQLPPTPTTGAMPPGTPGRTGIAGGGAAPPGTPGIIPPPPDIGAAAPTTVQNPAAITGQPAQPAIPPPPGMFYSPQERAQLAAQAVGMTESARLEAEMNSRVSAAEQMGLRKGSAEYANFVAGRMVVPFAHMQTKILVGPNGEPIQANFNPLTGITTDENGNVLENPIAWKAQIQAPTTEFGAYLQAARKMGQSDQEAINRYNDTESAQSGVRIEKDENGNFVAVPYTQTTSKTAHGALPAPPGTAGAGQGTAGAGGGGGGPKTRGASTGAAVPILDKNGDPIHQALSGQAKTTLFQIEAGTALLNRALPDLEGVVKDIGRGGNLWDSAKVRSAWEQYTKLGVDPSNVDPSSIVSMFPNVDPRIARLFPTLAQLRVVAAQPYLRGVRRYEFVQKVMDHIPDPSKDTPQLMLQKAQQLETNLPLLKKAVYDSEGVGKGPNALPPPPAENKPKSAPPASGKKSATNPMGI